MVTLIKKTVDAVVAWLTSPGTGVSVGENLFRWLGFRTGGVLEPGNVLSVLVVRVDQIGDAVLTTPMLRRLRHVLPDAEITLVTRPGVRTLFEECPYVDAVETFDPEAPGRLPALKRHWRALVLARRRLWGRRIELAVSPRWNKDMYHALFVAYFSGARWRAAYRQPVDQAPARSDLNILLTHAVSGRQDVVHEVERNMEFLERLGFDSGGDRSLELWVNDHDRLEVKRALTDLDVRRDVSLIALAPGAREKKKMWPIERFCAVASWLAGQNNLAMVVVGSAQERGLGERLEKAAPESVYNLCGHIGLRGVVALMDHCALFVGNDSGLMHIAAARGVPVVDISTHPATAPDHRPMSPRRFGPWGVAHRVVRPDKPSEPCISSCRAEEAHCILGVTTQTVIEASAELLAECGVPAVRSTPGDAGPRGRLVS